MVKPIHPLGAHSWGKEKKMEKTEKVPDVREEGGAWGGGRELNGEQGEGVKKKGGL